MIIYLGEDDPDRAVKTAWLKLKYHDNRAIPIQSLRRDSLADNRNILEKLVDKKEKLIICGHGNEEEFMARNPGDLYNHLINAGLNHDRFDSIYLLGCNAGFQFRDRWRLTSYLTQFALKIRQGPAWNVKMYAPRGDIVWTLDEYTDGVNAEWRVGDVRIQVVDDEGNVLQDYPYDHGMLLFR